MITEDTAEGDVTASSAFAIVSGSLYFRRTEMELGVAGTFCFGAQGESSL